MGIYSLLLLTIGIFIIWGVYATLKQKTLKTNLIFVLLLSIFVFSFFFIHHQVEETCEILIGDNISEILAIIRSWGIAAPLISILLMMLQAVIAPIPAYLITAANGIVFGVFWGVVISLTGALFGALIAFFMTRWFYSHYASRLIKSASTREYIEKISSQHGFKVILVARLIPIISFDFISYAAGASTIKISHFIVATFIGMLPATIVYTVLANQVGEIDNLSDDFITYSIVAASGLIAFWVVKNKIKK